jgi:hypothetical protein
MDHAKESAVKSIGLLLALFLLARVIHADTIKTGGNIINETWTPAGSPYIVQGDLTIPAGSFLTIQPGTEVRFASFDSQGAGLDAARVELTVKGTLNAIGTPAQPIVFKAQSGTGAGTWYGIVVDATATTTSAIANANIRHALYGIRSDVPGSRLTVNETSLSQNQFGAMWTAGTPTFDNVRSFANGTGLWVQTSGGGTVQNCLIYNNTNFGMQYEPTSGTLVTLKSCDLDSNGIYGIAVVGPGLGTLNVRDCIIANHNFGIYRLGPSQVSVAYSDVWSPGGTNFVNVTVGAGVISENPLFADRDGADNIVGSEDDNFKIQSGSPCIDAGTGADGLDDPSVPNTGEGGSSDDIGREELIPPLRIFRVEILTNDVRVTSYPTFTNKTYQLQASTNLSTDPASWISIGSPVPGASDLFLPQTDAGVAQQPRRFYRVKEN